MKNNNNATWPTMEDMDGVMDSIINIQIIHDMEATSLVNGKFKGITTNTKLDCERNPEYMEEVDFINTK